MSTTSSSEKNQQWQRQIHVKLSTIFKYEVSDTPQSFGSFFESIGKRYCAVSVLSKYLGYDIATAYLYLYRKEMVSLGKNTWVRSRKNI